MHPYTINVYMYQSMYKEERQAKTVTYSAINIFSSCYMNHKSVQGKAPKKFVLERPG